MVALNGERRPMKLYENVINALFVSFRSKGRGVIRNAFAPRDGGHLLLSLPHLASTFRLPLSLSLSLSLPLLFFLIRIPSFFLTRQSSVFLSRTLYFFVRPFFLLSHPIIPCSSFRLASQETWKKRGERRRRRR